MQWGQPGGTGRQNALTGEGGNVNVKNMETEVTFSYTKQALSFMV